MAGRFRHVSRMIRVSQLQFAYRDSGFLLSVEALALAPGEAVALTGRSGSGKTTLLSLLAGILLPKTGHVEVNGVVVSSRDDRFRREFRLRSIGLVFQEFELLEHLTVLDNLLLPFRLSSAWALDRATRDRAGMLAAQVGLADQLQRHPAQLSQGERQRAAMCRALLPKPSVLLADEPTGHLDPDNRNKALGLLLDYVRTQQACLLAVTHEHDILDRFDRHLDMNHLQGGSPT